MQVQRTRDEWLIRWRIDPAPPEVCATGGVRTACAFCDDDVMWIDLTDFAQMPTPSLVCRCDECGTATALAVLPITSRAWGETLDAKV